MITDDERFIKVQSILALSDIHPADCMKINDLIIELAKERNQFKEYTNHNYDKAKQLQEENKQLKDLVDTILNFEFFVGECPLSFDFGFNSNAEKAQKNFCNDEYCEKYCDNNYKDCWLKYFEKLQELEQGSDSNE